MGKGTIVYFVVGQEKASLHIVAVMTERVPAEIEVPFRKLLRRAETPPYGGYLLSSKIHDEGSSFFHTAGNITTKFFLSRSRLSMK